MMCEGVIVAGIGAYIPLFPLIKGQASYLTAEGRLSRFLTLETCQRPPRAVRTPRLFRAMARPRRLVTPDAWSASTMGIMLRANLSASWICTFLPAAAASLVLLGLPSFVPQAFRAARADLVRSEIIRRSFSASAA